MLIFGLRLLLSLKNCQMRPKTVFLRFSLKIHLLTKKLLNIQYQISDKNDIFNFGVRCLTDRTVTQLDVLQTK